MGGTLDGVRGDHVLLAPPFIVEEAQLDELVEMLERALAATLDRAPSPSVTRACTPS
jgi:adenosylmethionine-8-amino-7-oxononanoate aminotransferase